MGAAEVRACFCMLTARFMAPQCCLTTSPPPLSFFPMKEGWWRIDVLVNINTALASITKPSAINTEEWTQLGIRFSGGHYNHQATRTHFSPCFLFLKMNFTIDASIPPWPSCTLSSAPFTFLCLFYIWHLFVNVKCIWNILYIVFFTFRQHLLIGRHFTCIFPWVNIIIQTEYSKLTHYRLNLSNSQCSPTVFIFYRKYLSIKSLHLVPDWVWTQNFWQRSSTCPQAVAGPATRTTRSPESWRESPLPTATRAALEPH